jgi:hypothetical protein
MEMSGKVVKALEAEANDSAVKFEYEGKEYTCPPMLDWEHDALVAVEKNHIATLIELVLSSADLAQFRATKPKMKDSIAFAGALVEAAGTTLEKSEG